MTAETESRDGREGLTGQWIQSGQEERAKEQACGGAQRSKKVREMEGTSAWLCEVPCTVSEVVFPGLACRNARRVVCTLHRCHPSARDMDCSSRWLEDYNTSKVSAEPGQESPSTINLAGGKLRSWPVAGQEALPTQTQRACILQRTPKAARVGPIHGIQQRIH